MTARRLRCDVPKLGPGAQAWIEAADALRLPLWRIAFSLGVTESAIGYRLRKVGKGRKRRAYRAKWARGQRAVLAASLHLVLVVTKQGQTTMRCSGCGQFVTAAAYRFHRCVRDARGRFAARHGDRHDRRCGGTAGRAAGKAVAA